MLRALKVSYSDVGEGGVAVNCEKNTILPENSVLKIVDYVVKINPLKNDSFYLSQLSFHFLLEQNSQ